MATYVALLRGINVGGHKRMPMKQLSKALEGAGLSEVQTLLQSGNVVLKSPQRSASAVEKRVREAILAEFGFEVSVLVRSAKVFLSEVDANPFAAQSVADPKTVHFFFRRGDDVIDDAAVRKLQGADEETHAFGHVFYLHAPSGIGRSKLVARATSVLGETTARNARTVSRLNGLLRMKIDERFS
ncbi:MAG: DUF1697 domain-containing protein [Polyangiales bacterium]